MVRTSDKSAVEIEIVGLLKKGEEIIDDSHLTTKEGREILDKVYRLLPMCERLRESRDNWRNKFETLKETREELHNFVEDINPMKDTFDTTEAKKNTTVMAVIEDG